jgi:hypothetical protein
MYVYLPYSVRELVFYLITPMNVAFPPRSSDSSVHDVSPTPFRSPEGCTHVMMPNANDLWSYFTIINRWHVFCHVIFVVSAL